MTRTVHCTPVYSIINHALVGSNMILDNVMGNLEDEISGRCHLEQGIEGALFQASYGLSLFFRNSLTVEI